MAITLFVVLAEVDGTGVPLAYCFMNTFKDNGHGIRRAEPGATTAILDHFLRPLQDSRFDPTFFGTDKASLRLRQYAKYGQMRESSYVTGTLAGPFVQGSRLHVDPILKENTNP